MSNYSKIVNMQLEELATFFCYQFINGFEFLGYDARQEIKGNIMDWLRDKNDIVVTKDISVK